MAIPVVEERRSSGQSVGKAQGGSSEVDLEEEEKTVASEAEGAVSISSLALFAAHLVVAFTSFVLPLALVRLLTVSDYGSFKQSFLLVNMCVYLLPMGYGTSLYYFLGRQSVDRHGTLVFNALVVHGSIAATVCGALFLWPTIPELLFGNAELVAQSPLIGIVILLWTIARLSEMVTVANHEIRVAVGFIIFGQLSRAVPFVFAASQGGTVRALLLAAIAQGVVHNILFFLYLNSRFQDFWRRIDVVLMRSQFLYTLPLGIAGILHGLMYELPGLFMSHRFGVEAFAIYTVGLVAIPLINICCEPFNTTILRPISELQLKGKNREIIMLVAHATGMVSSLLIPLSVLFIVTGRDWIIILFTEQYAASWPLFVIALALFPLRGITTDPVIRNFAEYRSFPLKVRLLLLPLMLLTLALLPSQTGLLGGAAVFIFFLSLERLVEIIKICSILELKARDVILFRNTVKVYVIAAFAGLMAMAWQWGSGDTLGGIYAVATTSAVFGIVYLLGLFTSGVLSSAAVRSVMGLIWPRVFGGAGWSRE